MACMLPTLTSTKETTNYARLCRLLIEVGSQALREVFNKIHNPGSLHTALTKNIGILNTLKSKKVINPVQWGALFPLISNSVSSANFDITLLVALLRNICGLKPPATGWDAIPPSTDKSCQADIVRLRHFRNTVYAHVEKASVDDTTFNAQWHDIREVLVRLGGAGYGAAITQLETEIMHHGIETHFKDLLEQWKKDEDNIKDELCEIKNEIKNVSKKLIDVEETVEQLKGTLRIVFNIKDIVFKNTQSNGPEEEEKMRQVMSAMCQNFFETLAKDIPHQQIPYCLLGYLQSQLDVVVKDAAEGSLRVTVECHTMAILERLWHDYCSGHLNSVAEQCLLTNDIKGDFQVESVKLKTTILEEDYLACKLSLKRNSVSLEVNLSQEEQIHDLISEELSVRAETDDTTVEELPQYFQHIIDVIHDPRPSSTSEGTIRIAVQCHNMEILERLWEDYCSGRLNAAARNVFLTDNIRSRFDVESVHLNTTILEEDYLACKGFLLNRTQSNNSLTEEEEVPQSQTWTLAVEETRPVEELPFQCADESGIQTVEENQIPTAEQTGANAAKNARPAKVDDADKESNKSSTEEGEVPQSQTWKLHVEETQIPSAKQTRANAANEVRPAKVDGAEKDKSGEGKKRFFLQCSTQDSKRAKLTTVEESDVAAGAVDVDHDVLQSAHKPPQKTDNGEQSKSDGPLSAKQGASRSDDPGAGSGGSGSSEQVHHDQDPLYRQLEQRIAKIDEKVEQRGQEFKTLRVEDNKPGPSSTEQEASRSSGSGASGSSKQVPYDQEASPVKPFDVKTCRSKLAEHYKRTAKVPTSVWSSTFQVKLDQIYTPLSWVEKEQTPAGPSQSKLTHYSDLFTANKNGLLPRRILVQGQTGIGKSTFVKKLAVDWAELDDAKVTAKQKNALSMFQLVLVVPLKEVSSCETFREVISSCHLFPRDEEFSVDDLLRYILDNQEKVLLVFDGFNEYRTGSEAEVNFGSRSNSLISMIFHGYYLRNSTVLVTSRTSEANELQRLAHKHAEITGFDIEDQKSFMIKMLGSDSQVDQLLKFLKENGMMDLARVPLLNSFFCLLWQEGIKLLITKTKLYQAIIRHKLLYEHQKHSPHQVSKLNEEKYDEILNEIGKVALESLLKGNEVFKYDQLSEKLRGETSLVGLLQLSEYGASLEPMQMVSFTHKSIQEYLAARYITNKCVPAHNLGGIEEHVRTLEDCEAVVNVLQFICGLSSKKAVEVFKHVSMVRVSDPSLDLSKIIPDKESETYVPLCDVTDRHKRFNDLVSNCLREVSSEAERIKHWFDCTGGIVLSNGPQDLELLPKPEVLSQEAHSWAFLFHYTNVRLWEDQNSEVNRLYQSVKFLNLCHIPLRITESSEVLKLGDFLTKFQDIQCEGCCGFSSILCCRDGQIQYYITGLLLRCDAHIRMFTEAAATISIQSLSANLCSNQSCLKFLTSLNCVIYPNGELMKDLGAMIRNWKHLQRIRLEGSFDYACDLLEQVPNPGACDLKIGDHEWCTLISAGKERFAALLPRFPNISILHLDLSDCCAEAVTTLVTSITHKTLNELSLRKISFTPAAAVALGRALPEMTSLGRLELTGKDRSILHADEMEALFGGINKTLCLEILIFVHFRLRGNLGPLMKSLRFFPHLKALSFEELGMDGVGLSLLLDSFQFIPDVNYLWLKGNPLGHAVKSIVPHLTNLPKLRLLDISNTDCSKEDLYYVRKAAVEVLPSLAVFNAHPPSKSNLYP